MKEMKLLYLLFFFSVIALGVNSSDESEPDIHYVIDAAANGTATYIDLSSEKDYVYFSFDFDYHSKMVPASKDTAFFRMNSDTEYLNDKSVTYLFSNKICSDITYSDVKDLKWEETNIAYQEKSNEQTNYYFKFTRENEQINSLILKVSNNQKKTGSLTVENVLALPPGGSPSSSGNIFLSKMICLFLLILNIW